MGRRYRNRDEGWKSILWSLAALCLIWVGVQVYMRYVVQKAATDIMEIATKSAAQAQAQSRRVLEDQKRQAEQKALEKAAQEAALKKARFDEQQRILRKAAAWDAYFKPSARCKEDPINAECANEHIRAKKKFEASYADPS